MKTRLIQLQAEGKLSVERALAASPTWKPRLTRRGIIIIGFAWLMYALVTAIIISGAEGVPFVWAIFGQIFSVMLLAMTSIPIWQLLIRWMHSKSWYSKIILHILIAPFYGVINYTAYSLMLTFFTGGMNPLADRYGWIILYNVMLYIIQFSVFHATTVMKELRWREKQARELSALAIEQELAALKTQMNPHFLFNTLNSISAMVSKDIDGTRSMITQLADLLRYTITASKKDFVQMSDEIRFTKSYLELESKRFSDRLKIIYAIAPEVLSYMIPPLIIQPLVENAIKHGIEPSEDGGSIDFRASKENGKLRIEIKNTVMVPAQVQKQSEGNGVGLTNITSRLKLLYGEGANLSTHAIGGEFQVILYIPMR